MIGACALNGSAALSATTVEPAFRLGECRDTRVASFPTSTPPDQRVELANGLALHYDRELNIRFPLRPGQRVRVCLVDIGDYCGSRQTHTKTYLMFNTLTHWRQTLPDTAGPCAKAR